MDVVPTHGNLERFQVELVAVVVDRLAYDGRRGIYMISDRETGTQYLGVSGVGISEMAAHQVNKTQIDQDER